MHTKILHTLLILSFCLKVSAQPNVVLFKDLNPGGNSSSPKDLFQYDNKFLFQADDGTHGIELWISDGTASGTYLLRDINPNGSSFPQAFILVNNKVYFIATDGSANSLWSTDGTTAGTRKISSQYVPYPPREYNNKVLYQTYDMSTFALSTWTSDGTPPGTTELPFIDGNIVSIFNGSIIFLKQRRQGEYGSTLWKSDGTPGGTHMFKDMRAESIFTPMGNYLYFSGTADTTGNNFELWRTDGTTMGTTLVKDLHSGSLGSMPYNFTQFDNKMLFVTRNEVKFRDSSLWITDGTDAGTMKLINGQHYWPEFTRFKGKTYFVQDSNYYVTDGTPAGTSMITDKFYPIFTKEYKDKMYFIAFDSTVNNFGFSMRLMNLYSSDGTVAGTQKISIKEMGDSYMYPVDYQFFTFKSKLYMSSPINYRSYGWELWEIIDTTTPTAIRALIPGDNANTIYPNPATNTFSIKTDNSKNTTISIYSLTGQLMLQTKETQNINISLLPSGIYNVHTISGGQTYISKLMKE